MYTASSGPLYFKFNHDALIDLMFKSTVVFHILRAPLSLSCSCVWNNDRHYFREHLLPDISNNFAFSHAPAIWAQMILAFVEFFLLFVSYCDGNSHHQSSSAAAGF